MQRVCQQQGSSAGQRPALAKSVCECFPLGLGLKNSVKTQQAWTWPHLYCTVGTCWQEKLRTWCLSLSQTTEVWVPVCCFTLDAVPKALRVLCKQTCPVLLARWQGRNKEGCKNGDSCCWAQPVEAPGARSSSTFNPLCCFSSAAAKLSWQHGHSRSGGSSVWGCCQRRGRLPGGEDHLGCWVREEGSAPARAGRSARRRTCLPTPGRCWAAGRDGEKRMASRAQGRQDWEREILAGKGTH